MSQNPFADPYQSPQPFPPGTPLLLPGQKPPVWFWYVGYCLTMATLYLLGIVLAGAMMLGLAESDAPENFIGGGVLLVICLPLMLLFAAGPFLSKSKFAWIYGFVTIGIGFTSCCTLPFSIALLIYWLKPELRAYLSAL